MKDTIIGILLVLLVVAVLGGAVFAVEGTRAAKRQGEQRAECVRIKDSRAVILVDGLWCVDADGRVFLPPSRRNG